MDAGPLLAEIGRCLQQIKLEAVLIGNAAAALQGAPVTTVDFDFLFRRTPRNVAKLKTIADQLGATVLRPYYPASDLFRIVRDEDGLQLDFMATIHGLRSFEGVRDRASVVEIESVPILVASLQDVSGARRRRNGRGTGRFSRSWRGRLKKRPNRRAKLAALAKEGERGLRDQIRRWQALPPERRTNFLRKRVGIRRTAH